MSLDGLFAGPDARLDQPADAINTGLQSFRLN